MRGVAAVGQRQSFGVLLVQFERCSDCPRDLRNLDRVGQPVAEMVMAAGGENLSLALKTPESPRVNDAVAVALQIIPVRMRRFGKAAALKMRRTKTKSAQHSVRSYFES